MKRAVPLFFARATGQALDRVGLTVSGTELFKETYARHRPIMNLFDKVDIIGIYHRPNEQKLIFLHGNPNLVDKTKFCVII